MKIVRGWGIGGQRVGARPREGRVGAARTDPGQAVQLRGARPAPGRHGGGGSTSTAQNWVPPKALFLCLEGAPKADDGLHVRLVLRELVELLGHTAFIV